MNVYKRQFGVAYLFLLFSLALLAISALAVASLQYSSRIRSEEAELLRIGAELQHALIEYRDAHPSRAFPLAIEDMLLDKRSVSVKRHLRKLYFDPITRSREWGVVRMQGRIVGFHSLSEKPPMKIAGFDPQNSEFEGAKSYREWTFLAIPMRGIE